MAGVARSVDEFLGVISRFLHFRSARLNTASDMGQYLSATTEALFPSPSAPTDVTRRKVLRLPASDRLTVDLEWRSQHVPICPSYRVRHAVDYPLNQTAAARWTYPKTGPRKSAIVYVHGWLEPGPWIERVIFLPRLYDELDADVLYVKLPFHGSRNPKQALFHGELFWTGDLVRSFEAIRQSCIDTRTLVAWLRAQGYEDVGVTGISMGGSIAMMLACLDPTPSYVVPIVGHLHLSDALEDASIFFRMRSDLEKFGIDRARRKEIFDSLGLRRLRPLLPPSRQLWIMARDDAYITAPVVERQWHAWGEPPIEWIPGGHMTFGVSVARIVKRMAEFHRGLRGQS
jgi:hypothetical protein